MKKTKPWSKLKKSLMLLMDTNIGFDMHCSVHNPHIWMWPELRNARLWIVIGKENVWDFPNDFLDRKWIYEDIEKISDLIREYIETPHDELLTKQFDDKYQLVPILRACDRRVGKRRLRQMWTETDNPQVKMIVGKRLKMPTNNV